MKLGLINSAWLGSSLSVEEGIRRTRQIGFDTLDIFADPLEMNVIERRLIRETAREIRLPIVSVCCVALGISDFNAPVRRFHLDRCKAYLEMAYEWEARNLLLVLGEYIWQQEVIAPDDQWAWAVEGVRTLGEYAATLGLEIALELEPFKLSLINDVMKMRTFLDDAAHASVRANLDISHLALAHSDPEEIQTLKGRIAHVHLSDCDGVKHGDLPPGRGVVDFMPYLEELKKAGFEGALSIELEYCPDPGQIDAWVTEAYRAADRMMRSLGIRG